MVPPHAHSTADIGFTIPRMPVFLSLSVETHIVSWNRNLLPFSYADDSFRLV